MPDTFFTHAAIGNQFRRHHVSTEKSNLFENLSEDRKTSLMSCLDQDPVEVPIFGYWESKDEWLAVTTSRIAWSVNGERHHVRLADLNRVDADRQDQFQRQGMNVSEIKSTFHELTIEDRLGNQLKMHVEPGPPFYGVWSALRTLAVWANSERREAGAEG